MASEAFVCPHCRTWVEGSGRVVRCPSCGKRFHADEARLGRSRTAADNEAPSYDVPQTRWGSTSEDEHRPEAGSQSGQAEARERAVLTYGPATAPDYEAPVSEVEQHAHEAWTFETPDTDSTAPSDSGAQAEQAGVPWGWILGLAIFLLFAVGNRVLSGELLILAFIALVGAQWLLSRGSKG